METTRHRANTRHAIIPETTGEWFSSRGIEGTLVDVGEPGGVDTGGGTNRKGTAAANEPLNNDNDTRTNINGDIHCFYCGEEGHWADMCPRLQDEQQAQLQMNLGDDDEAAGEGG